MSIISSSYRDQRGGSAAGDQPRGSARGISGGGSARGVSAGDQRLCTLTVRRAQRTPTHRTVAARARREPWGAGASIPASRAPPAPAW